MNCSRQVLAASTDAGIAVQSQIAAAVQTVVIFHKTGLGTIEATDVGEFCRNKLFRMPEYVMPPVALYRFYAVIEYKRNLPV